MSVGRLFTSTIASRDHIFLDLVQRCGVKLDWKKIKKKLGGIIRAFAISRAGAHYYAPAHNRLLSDASVCLSRTYGPNSRIERPIGRPKLAQR